MTHECGNCKYWEQWKPCKELDYWNEVQRNMPSSSEDLREYKEPHFGDCHKVKKG